MSGDGSATSAMTSGSTGQQSTRPPEPRAYSWFDRRLKVMSVLLPVGFIVALELVHYAIEARDQNLERYWDGYRAIFFSVTVASIVAFGLLMLRFIDRAQRHVVRQNRELAATNALSSAVQGEVGVERIIDVALESVLATTRAAEASVTIFSTDRPQDNESGTVRRLAASGSTSLAPDDPGDASAPVIDIPLSTGTTTVGRMQLRLPVGTDAGDCLASGTLQNIGHQLASAIQLAQLVDDLQRRKHEGHAFYDVLLQISNQNAPP